MENPRGYVEKFVKQDVYRFHFAVKINDLVSCLPDNKKYNFDLRLSMCALSPVVFAICTVVVLEMACQVLTERMCARQTKS